MIWAASLLVGINIIALFPPAIGSWALVPSLLPGTIGTIEGTSRVATEKDGAGFLIYGPGTPLLAGFYQVTLEYESSGAATVPVSRVDVVYSPGLTDVADLQLPPSDANQGMFTYKFTVGKKQSLGPLFEFRVKYAGKGYLKVKRLTVTPISLDY